MARTISDIMTKAAFEEVYVKAKMSDFKDGLVFYEDVDKGNGFHAITRNPTSDMAADAARFQHLVLIGKAFLKETIVVEPPPPPPPPLEALKEILFIVSRNSTHLYVAAMFNDSQPITYAIQAKGRLYAVSGDQNYSTNPSFAIVIPAGSVMANSSNLADRFAYPFATIGEESVVEGAIPQGDTDYTFSIIKEELSYPATTLQTNIILRKVVTDGSVSVAADIEGGYTGEGDVSIWGNMTGTSGGGGQLSKAFGLTITSGTSSGQSEVIFAPEEGYGDYLLVEDSEISPSKIKRTGADSVLEFTATYDHT